MVSNIESEGQRMNSCSKTTHLDASTEFASNAFLASTPLDLERRPVPSVAAASSSRAMIVDLLVCWMVA